MRAFNLRTALESRPVERPIIDQDLEDTAKPSPIAGQIDGDTTTPSGMAKPGQNPVPDAEDVTLESKDFVDLDDVVLANQDRRRYEPLVSDPHTHDVVMQQNMATEGIVEKVKDFFLAREKEELQESTSSEENIHAIQRMKEKLATRPGEVRPGAEKITLSKYAKWLAINGKLIDNPAELLKELTRLEKFVDWLFGPYAVVLFKQYEFVSNSVLKLGESDLNKAYENLLTVLTLHKPAGVDQLLTAKETVTEHGNSYTDRVSPWLLGQWRLIGLEQPKSSSVQGEAYMITIKASQFKVEKGEFTPLDKATIAKVLDIALRISTRINSYTAPKGVFNRFIDSIDEFAYRYRHFKELSKEDQEKAREVYSWCNEMLYFDRFYLGERFPNHIVKVLLLYIEKSLRRVEPNK